MNYKPRKNKKNGKNILKTKNNNKKRAIKK
jgi:hypothetical protein